MASAIATTDKSLAEIYFGGAGDEASGLVMTYADRRYQLLAHTGRPVLYFAHYRFQAAYLAAKGLREAGHPIALIGHSWGSDAALRLAGALGAPVLLIAADPVAKPGSILALQHPRPDTGSLVLHVGADPHRPDTSDRVRQVGHWVSGGLARAWQEADIVIRTALNHWNFSGMMQARGTDGRTAEDWLSVYAPASRAR